MTERGDRSIDRVDRDGDPIGVGAEGDDVDAQLGSERSDGEADEAAPASPTAGVGSRRRLGVAQRLAASAQAPAAVTPR